MTDHRALESALIEAEDAAAVHAVVEDALTGPFAGSWADLGLTPREGLEVIVLTIEEKRAFLHASDRLREALAEVSRRFYSKSEEAV